MTTKVKTEAEISAMREGGKMLADVLGVVKQSAKPGMSTKDLANIARDRINNLDGEPAFLGMYGFPDVICISVNEEVVHGIPKKDKVIQDGDIVSCDFGVKYKGLITDSAISFIVGKATKETQRLLDSTKESLMAGIKSLKDDVRIGTIGANIQASLEKQGLGIVRTFVGHAVGHELHESPEIPNYGDKETGPALKAGMTVAIEPMATLGGEEVSIDSADGWTVRTDDNSLSAHFEHTILITQNGFEILTK